MANLATTLKEEIRRLARKEIRSQVGSTRQAVARYRREIAALKRQLQDQSKKLARLEKQGPSAAHAEGENGELALRFSAKSVRKQRERLGLSAADYGKLVGVSALTIYNWEHGKSRPRRAQLEALASVRGIGKRAAAERLGSS